MAEENTVSNIVKTASDGTVKIAVERYNELLEKAAQPKVINRTVTNIVKTPEMAAADNKAWGISFMALGVASLIVGGIRLKLGTDVG